MKVINVTLTNEETHSLWCALGEFRRVTRDQAKFTSGSSHSLELYDTACSLYKKLVETDKD